MTNNREWQNGCEKVIYSINMLDQRIKKTSMKEKTRQQKQNMTFILAYRIQYHIKTERILYIDSKAQMYFMIKYTIKSSRFIAGSQIAKHKDNSNVKNYHSQIA